MTYVDGFVIPVPRDKLAAYKDMASRCAQIWRDHGALEYEEWVAEDVKPGKVTSFPQSVMLEGNEVVVFSWIKYESRAHRDEVNRKVMGDPRMDAMKNPATIPFDGKRMIYGGFEALLEA